MPEAIIVAALRTPIGTAMKGTLRDTDAYVLADHVVGAAAADLDPSLVDDVILGEGVQLPLQGDRGDRRGAVLRGNRASTPRTASSTPMNTRGGTPVSRSWPR